MCICKPSARGRHTAGPFKSTIAVALTLVVAACSKHAPAPEPVRAVQTLTVASGQAGVTVEYAGEVRARVESRLGFRVGGKMVSRPVDVGDSVKAGQVLASLDAQDLRLGQDAARSAVQAARVNHEQALADFKRFTELRDQGFISAAELERRENTLKAAQAQLAQAQAQSSVQTNQASYGTLVADASGVVTAVEAEPGAVLSAGATVLRVAQDGPRDVVFSVPEDQVGALRAMQGRSWRAAGARVGRQLGCRCLQACVRWPLPQTRRRVPMRSRQTSAKPRCGWARLPPCRSPCHSRPAWSSCRWRRSSSTRERAACGCSTLPR